MDIANFRFLCIKYRKYINSIKEKDILDITILMYLDSCSMNDLYYESKEFINQLCLRIKYHNFANIQPLRLITIPELLKLYNDNVNS